MSNPIKAGYRSTEFYVALLSNVLTILVLFGVIDTEGQKTLIDAGTNAIMAGGTLLANAWVAYTYIKGRVEVKKAASK